jgi:hypothetical protein
MKKLAVVPAAMVAASVFFAPAHANAAPCRVGDPDYSVPGCANCQSVAARTVHDVSGCIGQTTSNKTGFPDCDAIAVPSQRAQCADEHIMGRR